MANEICNQTEEIKEKLFCITNLRMEIKTKPLIKWLVEYDENGIITKVLKNEAENG